MKQIDKFIHWYNEDFKQTELWQPMVDTCEGSPWHREHSVGVHTDMVVTHYLLQWSNDIYWSANDRMIFGAIACAFHDTGKPGARVAKHSEARGDYFAFSGHEKMSARIWEDYAVSNWEMLSATFGLVPLDIFKIGFLIEQHKPWDLKKEAKLNMLAETLFVFDLGLPFNCMLVADNKGRISDDAETKIQNALDWLSNFNIRAGVEYPDRSFEGKPIMFVPIGASATGKSTLGKQFNATSFSMDTLRTEWYGDDYSEAFQASCDDKEFNAKVMKRFNEIVNTKEPIFLDNTNTSRKGRTKFITQAKHKGYHVIAFLMPVSLDQLNDRQGTRLDKFIPPGVSYRQYMGLGLPQIGEVDDIQVLDVNL